jgi:large subunit ribosomal protein L23
MKKLEAVFTEKTLNEAKKGRYTFRVDKGLNKHQIKEMVEKMFGVNVTDIKTMNESGEVKRTLLGRKRIILPKKKAIVSLKDKEKIDIFEETK